MPIKKQSGPYRSTYVVPEEIDDMCNLMNSKGYVPVSMCAHPGDSEYVILIFKYEKECVRGSYICNCPSCDIVHNI